MNKRGDIGRLGEKIAILFLKTHGFLILDNNWHCRKGEIDIIFYDESKKQVVFAEVKARVCNNFYEYAPEQAITWSKKKKIKFAAMNYILKNNIEGDYRFDSISVMINKTIRTMKIRHIKSFF